MATTQVRLYKSDGSTFTDNDLLVASHWNIVEGKPSTYTPTAHPLLNHTASDLTTGQVLQATGSSSYGFDKLGEAFLKWGGTNHLDSFGPIDAAMVPELGANRFAFMPANAITIEYSRDAGATWTDYGADNKVKIDLFSGVGTSLSIGKNTSPGVDYSNYQLRVTLDTASQVYTSLNKFVVLCSISGSSGSWITIDARLQSNYLSNSDTWTTFSDRTPISGWSGYNVINTSKLTTFGNTATSQYGQIRFTFGCTGYNLNYTGLEIYKIFGFGGVGWKTPSNMAKTGHLYNWNYNQDAYFPSDIYANNNKILATQEYVTGKIPTSLKNPYTLTIQRNGTTVGTYDGSSVQTINITDNDLNNYLSGVSGSGNGTVTFTRQGLSNLTLNLSHTHSQYAPIDSPAFTGTPTIADVEVATVEDIPSVMSVSEGTTGTNTTQRTINAYNLKSIIDSSITTLANTIATDYATEDDLISHASSKGTTSVYGHVRTINNLTTSSYSNGDALSAYQGYVLQNSISSLQSSLSGKLSTSDTAYNSTRYNGYQMRIGSFSSGASGYITFSYE